MGMVDIFFGIYRPRGLSFSEYSLSNSNWQVEQSGRKCLDLSSKGF